MRSVKRPDLVVRAIRFVQNGRVFYAVVAPAGELVSRSKVDVWEADVPPTDTGYQRAPSEERKRQIADYIGRPDSVLPAGGFANVRSEDGSAAYGEVMRFEPDDGEDGSIQAGTLHIPGDAPIWVVDMQHRLGGFEVALSKPDLQQLKDFPVVVTIADGFAKMEEVQQFELINTAQKKVRTDLARRLLSIQAMDADKRLAMDKRGRLWEARGPLVADWLNTHDGVWKERIMPPNSSKKERPRAIIPETSFVTSLKPILQQPLFLRLSEEQSGEVLARYWGAIARVFPAAFAHPSEYVIQKTPGVFPFHALAPEIFELVRSRGRELSADNLFAELEPLAELGQNFWARDNDEGATQFGSMKGFRILAAELRSRLPHVEFELSS